MSKITADATRYQEGLFSHPERKLLAMFAASLPASVKPDHLSVLGFLAMFFGGIFYSASGQHPKLLWLVNLCILINWFGDSLDGTIARYRNCQRPRYGYYVDHIIDTFGTLFLIGGLAMSGYMSERVAGILLIVYFMLAINAYLATYSLGIFRLSYWRLSPTEIRIVLCIGNMALLSHSHVKLFGYKFLLFDVGGIVSIIGMGLMLVVSSIRNTIDLYREERV
jgi:archaetidylinositol phosphate synthase